MKPKAKSLTDDEVRLCREIRILARQGIRPSAGEMEFLRYCWRADPFWYDWAESSIAEAADASPVARTKRRPSAKRPPGAG